MHPLSCSMRGVQRTGESSHLRTTLTYARHATLSARVALTDLIVTPGASQEHGVFASAVFCVPLLLIASIIMCLSLRSTVNMMIVTKRLELKRSLRAKEQQQREREDGSPDATPRAQSSHAGTRPKGAPRQKAVKTQAGRTRLDQASFGKENPGVRRRT